MIMVRPEQVEIWPGRDADGLAARVVASQFHGHDTVMEVMPEPSSGLAAIVARTDGAWPWRPAPR